MLVWEAQLKQAVLPQGRPSATGQMEVIEVFAPIKCGRKQPECF